VSTAPKASLEPSKFLLLEELDEAQIQPFHETPNSPQSFSPVDGPLLDIVPVHNHMHVPSCNARSVDAVGKQFTDFVPAV
jgi:hypothetical protein